MYFKLALLEKSSDEGGSAVEHAHNMKLRKYEERCNAEAITFLPLAVDTFGGWHKVGLATITKLGRQLAWPGTLVRMRTRWCVTFARGWGS